jgi:hypothetical protein
MLWHVSMFPGVMPPGFFPPYFPLFDWRFPLLFLVRNFFVSSSLTIKRQRRGSKSLSWTPGRLGRTFLGWCRECIHVCMHAIGRF